MPPEPPGLTLYFSDIVDANVVKSWNAADVVVERRVMFVGKAENLVSSFGGLPFAFVQQLNTNSGMTDWVRLVYMHVDLQYKRQ